MGFEEVEVSGLHGRTAPAYRRLLDDNGLRAISMMAPFDRLGEDWEAEMSAVYDALGLELTDSALHAMRREMQGSEGGAHGAHAAQLERFAAAR